MLGTILMLTTPLFKSSLPRYYVMSLCAMLLVSLPCNSLNALAMPVVQSSLDLAKLEPVDLIGVSTGVSRRDSRYQLAQGMFRPVGGEEKRILQDILLESKTYSRYGFIDLENIEIQKKIRRPANNTIKNGFTVPNRVEKNATFLPAEVNTRMGINRKYRLGIYGKDLYILENKTNQIRQILYDLF